MHLTRNSFFHFEMTGFPDDANDQQLPAICRQANIVSVIKSDLSSPEFIGKVFAYQMMALWSEAKAKTLGRVSPP